MRLATPLDPGAPSIRPDAVFILGSNIKIVTAVACLQFVERGLITPDEPIDSILTELANQQLIAEVSDSSGEFTLSKVKNKITLRHLLTHTSAVTYDVMHFTLQAWRAARGEGMLSFSGKIIGAFDTLSSLSLAQPGPMEQATIGQVLLVARLTKMRFGAYCEQNIFTPLDMTSTFFSLELRPDLQEKLVVMCARDGDKLVTGGYGLPGPPQDGLGGVGLDSTVPDFMKSLTDLLQDHPKTLKPEIIDLLFTPQLEEDGVPMQAMKAVGPLLWGSS